MSLLENEVKSDVLTDQDLLMIELTDVLKFEAIKYRHEEQARLLAEGARIDLNIFLSMITLQIALGGFISQFEFSMSAKIGVILLDIALSSVCFFLLYFNHKRRIEIVATIKNCNTALGYETLNVYIKDKALNVQSKSISWIWMYFAGIICSIAGIVLLLFFS